MTVRSKVHDYDDFISWRKMRRDGMQGRKLLVSACVALATRIMLKAQTTELLFKKSFSLVWNGL